MVTTILEYKDKRSPMPPPLNVFFFIFRVLYRLLGCLLPCCRSSSPKESGFSDVMALKRTEEYLKKEREYQEKYLKRAAEEEEVLRRLERSAREAALMRE